MEDRARGLARREPEEGDGPSAADLDRFAGETRACPACGREVYDDAEVCYHCGAAMSGGRSAVPKWWVVVIVVAVAAALAGVFALRSL